MEVVPKFKNSALGLITLLSVAYTKFEVSSFTRSRYGIGAVKWLDARGSVPKLARGSPFFTGPPPNLVSIIVELSVLKARLMF